MRSIITVTDQILALLLPVTPLDGSNENNTACMAQLRVIRKQAMYTPVEAEGPKWEELGNVCYRYLLPPSASPYSEISQILTNSGIAGEAARKDRK